MINPEKIKPFIDSILKDNIDKDRAVELLKNEDSLANEEKRLIYMYCFPY